MSLIEERIEEVNFLFEAMNVDKKVLFEEINYNPNVELEEKSRRDFLAKANIKDAAKAKKGFDNKVESLSEELLEHSVGAEDVKNIRQKIVPDRRKLLMMAMKRLDLPEVIHNIESEDISFISQKNIDMETCTNCQMCYRICPTAALSSDDRGSFIAFDAIACIKCHSCHDVCEPDSITLNPAFNLEQLFKPARKILAKFEIKRCDECGMPFAYRGGEQMCERCRIEEQEAHDLWGIKT